MTGVLSDALGHDDSHGPSLSITRACQALDVSRSTWYRLRCAADPPEEDTGLRDQIQRIAVQRPSYGYRRITHEINRSGAQVNHKRVLRIMREDNLLCLRRKGFLVTTDSDHRLPIYPNLTKEMVVDRANQLWVADITYVQLRREFVYLAVVLDVFSRRVIGWELGRRLEASLACSALERALSSRKVQPGLVHHSDRGVQYASNAYVRRLQEGGIHISMSRRGNPYDNAYAESFIKTLKYEAVYLNDYQDLSDARRRVRQFLEDYNQHRLHSALGYRPPEEFEALHTEQALPLVN